MGGGQGNACRTFSRLQANLITQKSVPSLPLLLFPDNFYECSEVRLRTVEHLGGLKRVEGGWEMITFLTNRWCRRY